MSPDLENATKAAQAASLLACDLQALVRSDNPLLSDIALSELGRVVALSTRLERLRANLEEMEPTA
jgi:hypothetical protein